MSSQLDVDIMPSLTHDIAEIQLNSTTDSMPTTSTQHPRNVLHFLELPLEIRDRVYHELFDDLRLSIRQDNGAYHPIWEEAMFGVQRRQKHGFNIIFVSKQCLAEAKPILLSSSQFNVDLYGRIVQRREQSGLWLKQLQGFCGLDLNNIRRMALPSSPPSRADRSWPMSYLNGTMGQAIFQQVLGMPHLQELTIMVCQMRSEYSRNDFLTKPEPFLDLMLKEFPFTMHTRYELLPDVFRHLRCVAQETNHRPRLLFAWSVRFKTPAWIKALDHALVAGSHHPWLAGVRHPQPPSGHHLLTDARSCT
jgi:hypothetical protein